MRVLSFPFLIFCPLLPYFFGPTFPARFFCHLHTYTLALPARCTVPFLRYICPHRSYYLCSNALCSCSPALCFSVVCLSVLHASNRWYMSICYSFTSTNPSCYRVVCHHIRCASPLLSIPYITMQSRNVSVEKKRFFKRKAPPAEKRLKGDRRTVRAASSNDKDDTARDKRRRKSKSKWRGTTKGIAEGERTERC